MAKPADPDHIPKPTLRRDIVTTLALIVLAVLLEFIVEHTQFAHHLAFASYRMLQQGLASSPAPITIVDISALPSEPTTSRERLQDLLVAIVSHDPVAIGVDIDFGPSERGSIDPRDPLFFDFCLRLSRRTPTFLGVERTTGGTAAQWLGNARYQSLATTIVIPHDTRRMPYTISGPDSAPKLRSMSAALAQSYGEKPPGAITARLERAHLITRLKPHVQGGLTFEEFLVDYSAIESLFTIATTSPDVLRDSAFDRLLRGRIVLVGDFAGAADRFPVPGRNGAYPGIALHGAAAHTLASGPLYDVTHLGRVVLTATLLVLVLGPVVAARAWSRARGKKLWITQRLQGTLIVVLTLVAVVCAGLLVRVTHILWDGFFLAFFALAFHQPVEDLMHAGSRLFTHLRAGLEAEE